jgi:phosphoribosylformylglycinamidine synthase
MASKGGCGIELDLDHVPQRETNMVPYEIMLSESQERMLMVLKPGREAEAEAIFRKWELDFAVIGRVTDTGRMVLKMYGRTWADMPVAELVDASPNYARPWEPTPPQPEIAAASLPLPETPEAVLERMLACPDLASKRWIWEQYDSRVGADTVALSGEADAALVRVHGTGKLLAITTDCTPRYCLADPERGGAQAVAEAWRNLTATGATPLAITDNMNFGNPQKPRIMGQFVGCIQGMISACQALDFPVVSGNVSLYNETSGEGILPTPAIGGVGLIQDGGRHVKAGFKAAGEAIVLIGETQGHVGTSLYAREIHGREDGAPPPVDLAAERRNGDLVRTLIQDGTVTACHDLADGGLYVAVAEMAMTGRIGATVDLPAEAGLLFGEDQGRYLVTAADGEALLARARAAGVPAQIIGRTGGDVLKRGDGVAISVDRLRRVNEAWLPGYMTGIIQAGDA